MRLDLEICAQGIASALAAEAGGADRVELCEDLAVGGVTPGPGTIGVVCRRLSIPIHVLIRPRGGDFVYSEAEFEAMVLDVEAARTSGAAGVVLGVLTADGRVDRDRSARLVEAARPLAVTFHKAFDATPDMAESLDDLIGLGIDRVLSSGGAPTVNEGMTVLRSLIDQADGRIAIMAGGHLTEADIPRLVAAGIRQIHVGSAAGPAGRTDVEAVRRLAAIVRSCKDN